MATVPSLPLCKIVVRICGVRAGKRPGEVLLEQQLAKHKKGCKEDMTKSMLLELHDTLMTEMGKMDGNAAPGQVSALGLAALGSPGHIHTPGTGAGTGQQQQQQGKPPLHHNAVVNAGSSSQALPTADGLAAILNQSAADIVSGVLSSPSLGVPPGSPFSLFSGSP